MMRMIIPFLVLLSGAMGATDRSTNVVLTIDTRHEIAKFDPRSALGAGLDGHWDGETEKMFTPQNVNQMMDAGLGPISIRLRTELAVEAWHWNPKGMWSDPLHHQGYWTSDAKPDPSKPIILSYGYKLPRRGHTLDEANDDGYSMLDDGDPLTFWKSNPYLSQPYTGETDSHHPQWVILDFGNPIPINAIWIRWAVPYAKKFIVEYATKGRVYFGGHPWNVWKRFPKGRISHGEARDPLLKLCDRPVKARYLRIWMTEGSGTAPAESHDLRDHLGYAIREISAGVCDEKGIFHDQVSHATSHAQTLAYVSSTDPWHRAQDRDPKVEQPGIDLLSRCGITRGLPLMLALPVFYDTPENAAALASYVHQCPYPVSRCEMGEEPDGQRIDPRDFGALYAQTALAVRKVAPGAVMGGPSFVTVDVDRSDDKTYRFDKRWWIRDFLAELKKRRQSHDFNFLSFEWYPFDDVLGNEAKQLPLASGMLDRAMKRLRSPGMPRVPLVIGEFNYSVFPCRQEVDLAGAFLNAETAAQFLCSGGDAAFYYGYEPNRLEESSGSWGNQMMLLQGRRGGSATPLATFHTMRMLTNDWLDPKGGLHSAFEVKSNLLPSDQKLLSSFMLRRPDGSWALLLINKNTNHAMRLNGLDFKAGGHFFGPLRLVSYSSKEYSWHPDGARGHPFRNRQPESRLISRGQPVVLPPCSISVLRADPISEKTN